jgi:hypothetical protein
VDVENRLLQTLNPALRNIVKSISKTAKNVSIVCIVFNHNRKRPYFNYVAFKINK